ncbi:unnamed protein product [Ostreobium quekettii]|uniref:Uncharacterized protein n=1 Tax=Ostreobium quekettii TaxID=121088 RepID=A0A8S1J7F9_9CHLO|nr:unnamed protein product [Ostreobium quekettii]
MTPNDGTTSSPFLRLPLKVKHLAFVVTRGWKSAVATSVFLECNSGLLGANMCHSRAQQCPLRAAQCPLGESDSLEPCRALSSKFIVANRGNRVIMRRRWEACEDSSIADQHGASPMGQLTMYPSDARVETDR